MDNTEDPYEAGLGFTVRLDKPGDFIGKQACIARKKAGPLKRRLAQVLVKDPAPLLYHGEIILRNQTPAGYVRSGSYGHTLGGAVGLFMIEADAPVNEAYVKTGTWEIDIAGKIFPATVSLAPLYDPEMTRVKS
jgi:4-methylaminobutanoate oxidase (formaldehyde-forming)